MKNIKIIFLWLLLVVASIQVGYCQPPDASAKFTKVEKEISTTPEFPGICNPNVGIQVTINETFVVYLWTAPSGVTKEGKTVTLHEIGMWNVSCFYEVNGVQCSVRKELFVANLRDPDEIIKYFENAEFWEVPIFRGQVASVACRNCGCENELESISFISGGGLLKLTNQFENFANFRPFQGLDYQKNITNNSCLCNEDGTSNIPQFESSLGGGDLSVWGHQFFKDPNIEGGTLFLKASMSWQSASPVGSHRNRLTSIKEQLVSSGNTAEQGRKIFTNLFMNQPIGGYELNSTMCHRPEGCKADGNYLTPAGAIIKLPENGTQFNFAQKDNNSGVIEGTLLGFNDGTENRIPFKYLNNQFAGYYNDLSASVFSGFNGPNNVVSSEPQKIYFPIAQDGQCIIRSKKVSLDFASDTEYGGIYEVLPKYEPDFIQLSTSYLNADAVSASFMAGTGKIISLPYADIQDISFAYNSYSDGDVRNISNGILHKFELENQETCVDGLYTYTESNSSYVNEEGVVYEDNYTNVEKFIYPMMCEGQMLPFAIFDSGFDKHKNGDTPSYINDFDGLTSFFTPSSMILTSSYIKKECTYCISDEFADIITDSKYCGKPEHIIVEKIAQLATVYPDYFKDPEQYANNLNACGFSFTQLNSWEIPSEIPIFGVPNAYFNPNNYWPWSSFLTANPDIKAKFKSNNVAFFREMITQIDVTNKDQKDWWNDVAIKTVNEIVCHLRVEPQNITSTIPWDKKLIGLNKLYTSISNLDAQYGVIHILAASPSQLIEHIEAKTIQYFWDNFSSSGEEDNRSRIVNLICSKTNGEYVNMHQYHINPSSMPALEANAWSFENLTVTIGANLISFNGQFSSSPGYNEIIPVKISGNFTIGGQEFQEGLVLYVPALQAALYAVKNQKAVQDRVAWVAVDLGLLAVGVGAYKYVWTSANYLRKGFIVADVVGSVLGVTAQLLDNIDDDTRTKIQLAALVASGPEIGISIAEAVSSTRILRNKKPNYRPAILSADEIRLALAQKDLQGFDDAWNFVRTNPRGADAWEGLLTANTNLRKNKNALEKCAFLLNHWVSEAQLLKIGQLDDIKAIIIAENLAKRVKPSIPLNQIDLIPINTKALENIRPNILDEISNLSGNPNLRNPDRLHSFIQDALANSNSNGWKYELDIALQKINGGASIEFSRKVSGKEIDILDYTNSQIIEVKSYSSPNYISILKNFGNDVGAQIGIIDNAIKSQFTEHIGRVRVESSGNSIWFEANKQELINRLKQGRIDYPEIVSGMDNMTHLIIENSTGVHTIQKALWQ